MSSIPNQLLLKLVKTQTGDEKAEHDLMITSGGKRFLKLSKCSLLAIVYLPTGEGSPLNDC